jgi:hypothetical protein
MKFKLTVWVLFGFLRGAAQGNYELLERELPAFAATDTVAILGLLCSACNGSYPSQYFLVKKDTNRVITITRAARTSTKTFDSTFKNPGSNIILDYAHQNYDKLSYQFKNYDSIFSAIRVVNGRLEFTPPSEHGLHYYVGLYSKNRFTWSYVPYSYGINYIFKSAQQYWVYFSLLKNEWPQIDLLYR